MFGRLSGTAPSGKLKSCGGRGRPCEGLLGPDPAPLC